MAETFKFNTEVTDFRVVEPQNVDSWTMSLYVLGSVPEEIIGLLKFLSTFNVRLFVEISYRGVYSISFEWVDRITCTAYIFPQGYTEMHVFCKVPYIILGAEKYTFAVDLFKHMEAKENGKA